MIEQWGGVLHTLAGFENNFKGGWGIDINFILTNGQRSWHKEDFCTIMMPKGVDKKIRFVRINHDNKAVYRLEFFDKEQTLIFEIGFEDPE